MKVAGYVRVSTELQRDDGSHIRQRERLEDWAEEQGHDLTLFEDIAISGQSDEREQYAELMERLDEFDAVVVRELSRFGRSLKTVLQDVDRLTEENVQFISLTEDIDTESAMGRAFLQMIGVLNEFWANQARERTLELHQKKMEAGEDWGRPEKLDQQDIQELLKDREKGLSYASLAKLYQDRTDDGNLARSTVRRYCQKYGNEEGEGDA